MTVTYFKRYKMRIDLSGIASHGTKEFEYYSFQRWRPNLTQAHAEAKYASFCDELDSHVFPCLGNIDGCLKLMNEISCRTGFVPEATWLVVYQDQTNMAENCGTVQGIRDSEDSGSIQNLGIAQGHRGKGLGSDLLLRSLQGFAQVGVRFVSLEVTAQNEGALNLYRRIGFEVTELVYKSADLKYR